jgi:hypothetical protein
MPKLRNGIEGAVESDASFAGQVPKLRAFLGAKKEISHRAVASRKAKAEERAMGKEAKRGRRAQAKRRAAENVALAPLTAASVVCTQPVSAVAETAYARSPTLMDGAMQSSSMGRCNCRSAV